MNPQAFAAGDAPPDTRGIDMFGKTRDIHDDTLSTKSLDEFFGDETAADNAVELLELRDRVEQVEAQINSQFTSLATYAQIAQEQVELARSEAKAATERSEQRVTSLIERERADRVTSLTGEAPEGSPALTSRLDALEHSVARIQKGFDDCRQQQKELALAITGLFDRLSPGTTTRPAIAEQVSDAVSVAGDPFRTPPRPDTATADEAVDVRHSDADAPITGLALNG